MNLIETPRLRLRRWQEKDKAPFAAMNADPRVMEFMPAPLTREESDNYIAKIEGRFTQHGFGLWAAEIRDNNVFIGFIGLNVPNFKAYFTPCVEIGWRLAAEHWGKGYAAEGAKAALDCAFSALKLPEVLSWTYEGNRRSRRVMERIGMTHREEETFAHPKLPAGHWLDRHVLYRINNPKEE